MIGRPTVQPNYQYSIKNYLDDVGPYRGTDCKNFARSFSDGMWVISAS
jgi:hypothetical protein